MLRAELDEDDRSYAVDELLKAAHDALHDGRFREFRGRVASAQSLFSSLRVQSVRQKALLLLAVGLLQEDASEPAPFDDSRRMLAACADMARKEGLVLIAIDAQLSGAGLRATDRGDTHGAMREALPAVKAALHAGDRAVIGSVCVYAAGLSNSNADFRDSLRFAELAMRYGKLDEREQSLLHSGMAHAYFALGDAARASRLADDACRIARRAGNRRLLGATRRVAALAHHANRETNSAREGIEEALHLLDGHGSWHALRDAYRASAIITGNRDHARRAAMLTPRPLRS
jgi:tetratricopeptide (TPR) repeat protein